MEGELEYTRHHNGLHIKAGDTEMLRILLIFLPILFFGTQTSADHLDNRLGNIVIPDGERIHFQSYSENLKRTFGLEHKIFGQLFVPEGEGPFPAVILSHDWLGLYQVHREWGERLKDWGYIAFMVDSFDPRGMRNGSDAGPLIRAADMYGALQYLKTRKDVIPDKVAIMGWSQGGTSVLVGIKSDKDNPNAVDTKYWKDPDLKFSAAIAYYPSCGYLSRDGYTPLLVLIGDRDDEPSPLRGSVQKCRDLESNRRSGNLPIRLKVFENATHVFDYYLNNAQWAGAVLDRNPDATAQSILEVKEFLQEHSR